MPPNSDRIAMMRWWADEFDQLMEHCRHQKWAPEEKRVQSGVAPL